ncbi:MAG: SUMF1/EgtB/PvdO family nonheme iron enzyme [Minicystis sp.]
MPRAHVAWPGLIGIATMAGCALVLGIEGEYHNTGEGGKGGAPTTSSSTGGATSTTTSSSSSGAPITGSGGAGGMECADVGARKCTGTAQPGRLVCSEGYTWQPDDCPSEKNCDNADPGVCKDVLADCAGKTEGTPVCVGQKALKHCGPDLVSLVDTTTCKFVCLDGACTGECEPGTGKRCLPSAQVVQKCNDQGQWEDEKQCKDGTAYCDKDNAVCVVPPSCAPAGPGLTDCDPNNLSCCTSKVVPGNDAGNPPVYFYRSYDGLTYMDMSYPALVSDFLLDRYEITVGRFRSFVDFLSAHPGFQPNQDDGEYSQIPGSGWRAVAWSGKIADAATLKTALKCGGTNPSARWTWTDTPGANENKPINCITWYEAFAFCAWDGGRLPTEAEWNYAAAGGTEQRRYPWGSADVTLSKSVWNCFGDGTSGCTAGDILKVGTRTQTGGDGNFGQADLSGGMWEWTLDRFANYATFSTCHDCANLAEGAKSIRGGAWNTSKSNEAQMLTAYRNSRTPDVRSLDVGARCARSLK